MKRHAPATDRNAGPLLAALRSILPDEGDVLEIASGTGQHAAFFAPQFPEIRWQPTDQDPEALLSIAAWAKDASAPNLAPPLTLDVTTATWPITKADGVLCVNMIHIAPWAACVGLFAGAGKILPPNGPLILYGPFLQPDVDTAPSNRDFDAALRARNPAWGIRDLAAVTQLATVHGFRHQLTLPMPANNLTVVFVKA